MTDREVRHAAIRTIYLIILHFQILSFQILTPQGQVLELHWPVRRIHYIGMKFLLRSCTDKRCSLCLNTSIADIFDPLHSPIHHLDITM